MPTQNDQPTPLKQIKPFCKSPLHSRESGPSGTGCEDDGGYGGEGEIGRIGKPLAWVKAEDSL